MGVTKLMKGCRLWYNAQPSVLGSAGSVPGNPPRLQGAQEWAMTTVAPGEVGTELFDQSGIVKRDNVLLVTPTQHMLVFVVEGRFQILNTESLRLCRER